LTLAAGVVTAGEIWDQLQLGPLDSVMIAVNQQLVGPEQVLNNGDELAFLPPFTGG
jgi:molybdopterin synthase sulfur carrier subunit